MKLRITLLPLGTLALLLLLLPMGPRAPSDGVPDEAIAAGSLEAGQVLVLASWKCSPIRLDQVNEVAMELIREPLTRAVEEGQLVGWGQMNGTFRAEYNYHTYYLAPSEDDYRSALRGVVTYMNRDRPDELRRFYDLCERTEETIVTVVAAHPTAAADDGR